MISKSASSVFVDPRVDDGALGPLLHILRDFETSLLANTIGYLDATPPDQWYLGGTIRSVTPSVAPTVGVAITCTLDSSTPGTSADMALFWEQLEQMRVSALPTVWVVQCVGSRPDHECVIGEGMAKLLTSVGCGAVVTDGGVRDIRGLLTVPLAAYCRGPVIHHGPLRFALSPGGVDVGGVRIKDGEILHGDAEGVIKIPSGCLHQLADAAVRMRAAENEVHAQCRRIDLPIDEKKALIAKVFARYGFGSGGASAGTMEPTR